MIFHLALKSLSHGKTRFLCAALGIAAATATMVFNASLVATNNAQAPHLARKAAAPWTGWKVSPGRAHQALGDAHALTFANLTVDYRPGGHVLQGPPMRATLARAPRENPYGAVHLTEGRWVDETSPENEVVCTKASMSRFAALAPALGETVKFVGMRGTMSAKIVGYLEGAKLPREFPTAFASHKAFDALTGEDLFTIYLYKDNAPLDALTYDSPDVLAQFKSDEQRRMDYATPLLVVASILTALSLLVNSLLLSIEANWKTLAILRMAGMERRVVLRFVLAESLVMALFGWLAGVTGGVLGIWIFTSNSASFPAGSILAWPKIFASAAILAVLVTFAMLFMLRPALSVKPLDALAKQSRPRRNGMAVTFALGFAAFVAVEVWGASLMRAFVPSPEWPDAIVSLLPGGTSSFDIKKLRDIEGVKRISELLPLQVYLEDAPAIQVPQPRMRGKPNALFLAAEWLPRFRFVEGDYESACDAILKDGKIVITEMMSRARNLHKGDTLLGLEIAGVVDLNWHMVTSRGLLRGLNRMPGMTDGPVFASFDTVESLDRRPAPMVRMTHLWIEYESEFLAKHGVFPAGRKIESAIASRLGNSHDYTVRLHARDEIADGTLAHGSDVIGAAARVPFVFLAILAIGFVAMLVAEADARRHELAALRAVGATRAQLALTLVRSALKVAATGIVCGFPIGASAGYIATFKTAAMWPGLPHYFLIPWAMTIEGAIGAVAFALLFAVPSAVALARCKN